MQGWINRGLPGGNKGPWVEADVREWLRVRGSPAVSDSNGAAQNANAATGDQYLAARARKMMADAAMVELKVERLRGELVRIDEAKSELEDSFAWLRDVLKRWADELAVEFPAEQKPTVIAFLNRKVDGLLHDFANKLNRVGESGGK